MTRPAAPVHPVTGMPIGHRNANPAGIGFAALVAEDFRTHNRAPFSQGFWALFWHRFGNLRMGWPKPLRLVGTPLYWTGFKLTEWLCNIHLPYVVQIGRRVRLEHFGMILVARSIGDDVVIRQNCTMGVKSDRTLNQHPVIGNRVEIGAGAVIVGGVRIGDGATVGANAVVIADVPEGATVGGIPARVL